MATPEFYAPPGSAQNDHDELGAPLDEHYLSLTAQQTGKQNYRRAIGDADAQKILDKLLDATRLRLQHIKQQLVLYGDAILRRWKKYNHERRATLLREAWSGISDGWIRAEAWKGDPTLDPWGSISATIGPITWLNSANIARLAQDSARLISLLHLRSEYEPHEWANFDIQSALTVFEQSPVDLQLLYNASSVVMYGEAYGTVKKLDVKAAHSWAEAGFPRANVTFAMQYHIALWLDTAVDALVANAEPSGNTRWKAMLAGGLHSTHDEALWSPYHFQEFAAPSNFDVDGILQKTRNHLNMLVDEIELMQTSPEHMRQYVLEVKENMCFNYDGTKSAAEEWQYIARMLAISWTNDIARWQRLVAECEHLRAVVTGSGAVLVPGARLSGDTATAMRSFGLTVVGLLTVAALEWQSQFRTVNIMRDYLRRCDHQERSMRLHQETESSENLDPKQQSDRVVRWAGDMAEAIVDRKLGGISWHMQKLKAELEGAAYSRGLENWMSGVALMDEIALLWSRRQTVDYSDNADARAGVRSRDMLPSTFDWMSKQGIDCMRGESGDLESSQLLRRFCELPLPVGPKNPAWLKKMMDARKSLTDVWNSIRNNFNEHQKKIERSEVFRNMVLSQISFDISPEHIARVDAEYRQLQEGIQSSQAHRERGVQGSGFVRQAWDFGTDNGGAVRRNLTKKVQAARKGAKVGDVLKEFTPSNVTGAGPAFAQVPQIAIKQDSMSVISKLFPAGPDGSSSVRWTQLVQALADAGLIATQAGGSAVSFASQHGSVTIHKPHPDPVVDAIRLRAIGRRLRKWLGWCGELFVVRQKGDKKSEGGNAPD